MCEKEDLFFYFFCDAQMYSIVISFETQWVVKSKILTLVSHQRQITFKNLTIKSLIFNFVIVKISPTKSLSLTNLQN